MEACLRCRRIVSSQSPYNALRRDIERNIVPFCRNTISGSGAQSAGSGLLTGKVTWTGSFRRRTAAAERWFRLKTGRVLDMLEKVRRLPVTAPHG